MATLYEHLRRHRHDHQQPALRASVASYALLIFIVALTLGREHAAAGPSGPVLGVAGRSFTLDGRPVFLIGVSLFDALGAVAPRDSDLEALREWGVNTVRVWAHWHKPIYQADGSLTPEGRTKLLGLAERLRSRGMVLELAVLRPGQLPGQRYAVFESERARLRAVETITEALRDYRNVLFDLCNEHDHPDGPLTHDAVRAMRERVKALDAARLVTVSSTESHLSEPDGKVGDERRANLRAEVSAQGVGVDVLAPHFPRTDQWADLTAARVAAIRAALTAEGRDIPVYLNEENRTEGSKVIAPETYKRAYAAAREAGAAGWVFHTDAGYALDKRPFVDALRPEERTGLSSLSR